jgi:hypothetical protein
MDYRQAKFRYQIGGLGLNVANVSRLPGQSSFFQAIECRQKQGLMHRTVHTASASRPRPPGARCGAISTCLDNAARADLKRHAQRIVMRPLPPMYLLRETLQRLNQQHITALLGDTLTPDNRAPRILPAHRRARSRTSKRE